MFKCTEDAILRGLGASIERRLFWHGLRRCYRFQTTAALDRGQLDLASVMATQAQFCREARGAKYMVDPFEHFRGRRR